MGRMAATGAPPAQRRRQPEAFDPRTMQLIRRTARQLARQPGFADAGREDMEQELALELLLRRGDHDPERGTWAAFARGVIRHRAIAILRQRDAEKRGAGSRGLSLDDEVWSEGGERLQRGDTLGAADGERRLGTKSPSTLQRCACRMDVEAVLARLPEHLRRLCELLKVMPVAAAARHAGITRDALRRDLCRMRDLFVTSGVTSDLPAPIRGPFAY
ncbi:MAG TPA: hypothetical protein VNE39_27000 [Planctomycetota bacterium]|nr:hypothetical protein [Planctomycetota bacterium]